MCPVASCGSSVSSMRKCRVMVVPVFPKVANVERSKWGHHLPTQVSTNSQGRKGKSGSAELTDTTKKSRWAGGKLLSARLVPVKFTLGVSLVVDLTDWGILSCSVKCHL